MMMSINLVMNPFTDILPMTEMYHFHPFQFVCFLFKFNALKSVA